MFSVGDALKRARVEQGLDLAAVSAQTRISVAYLQAIESDDRKQLPSGFFYKSFVHQYANFLSVDLKEIDQEIDRQLATDAPLPLPGRERAISKELPPVAIVPRFRRRRLSTSFVTLMLVLVACSGVYAWWHDATLRFASTAAQKAELVESPAIAAPQTQKPADTATVQVSETPVPQPPAEQSATPESAVAAPAEPAAPAGDYKVLLDLMAREATWLSVSSDGKPVFSGTLAANETRTIEGKQFAKVRVGNAAGLQVRLNGKMLGPLGARGQVLVVLFTPDNFEIVSPNREGD
jgi:cytoskeletal protein RodZ